MMDVGFSKTEIGVVIKSTWHDGGTAGSVLGGIWMVRLGLLRSMLAVRRDAGGVEPRLLRAGAGRQELRGDVGAVVIEHVTHAMGNIAVVALMMALCDMRFSAFQYALLSALSQCRATASAGPQAGSPTTAAGRAISSLAS